MGSLVSFLFLNFPPAKIFLGDTGSQLLGWTMAISIVYMSSFFNLNNQKIYLLSLISLPFFDVIFVMIKRFLLRDDSILNKFKGIVKPDQNHIHHILLKNGFSVLSALILLSVFYFFCLSLSILPIYFNSYYTLVFLLIVFFYVAFRLFFEFRLNK